MDYNSKILITGVSGMVGHNTRILLEQKGYKNIVGIDKKIVDLTNQNQVNQYFKKERPTYVFHFAAKVGGIMANMTNQVDFCYENLMINLNVLHACHEYKVEKLINLGSSCIYPRESKQPIKEEYMLTGSFEPTNEGYAIAKSAGLKLCEYYNNQYNTQFLTLIPPNLYGNFERFDSQNSHVLISLVHKFKTAIENKEDKVVIWGTGNPIREFMHVKDLANGCIFFMEKIDSTMVNNKHTNIGTGEGISIKDLANMIAKKLNYHGSLIFDTSKPDGMPIKVMDITKIQKLGFSHKYELDRGLDLFIKYLYKQK